MNIVPNGFGAADAKPKGQPKKKPGKGGGASDGGGSTAGASTRSGGTGKSGGKAVKGYDLSGNRLVC